MKSAFVVGALVIAFVFYTAAKNTLPNYIAVFLGPVTPGPAVGAGAASVASSALGVGTALAGTGADLGTNSSALAGAGTQGAAVANSDITDTSFGSVPDSGDFAGSLVGGM